MIRRSTGESAAHQHGQLARQGVGQRLRERGQQHAAVGRLPGQAGGAVQRHHGLAGAGRAGGSRRAGVAAIHDALLAGVQEHRPALPGRVQRQGERFLVLHHAEPAQGVGMGKRDRPGRPAPGRRSTPVLAYSSNASAASAGRWSASARNASSVAACTSAIQSCGTPTASRSSADSAWNSSRGRDGAGSAGAAGVTELLDPLPHLDDLDRAGARMRLDAAPLGPEYRHRRGGRHRPAGSSPSVLWTMMRRSPLTRTDQKCGSRDRSIRWNFSPGADGSICRSKAVVFAAFCSAACKPGQGGGEGGGDAEFHQARSQFSTESPGTRLNTWSSVTSVASKVMACAAISRSWGASTIPDASSRARKSP